MVIAKAKSNAMRRDAAYWKSQAIMTAAGGDAKAWLKAVDEFIAFAPRTSNARGC